MVLVIVIMHIFELDSNGVITGSCGEGDYDEIIIYNNIEDMIP